MYPDWTIFYSSAISTAFLEIAARFGEKRLIYSDWALCHFFSRSARHATLIEEL